MHAYKFDIFPRYVGTPYQKRVDDYSEFYAFVYSHNGIEPLYTTHNPINGKIIYIQQFMDLDTDFGATLEEARQDMLKLYKYFDKYDKVMSFSSNGFHFYLRFYGDYENQFQLSASVKQFQSDLVNKLHLKSLNLVCAEPRHLARIPGTRYVTTNPELKSRHCIPIDISTLERPLDEIIDLSIKNRWNLEDNEGKELYPLESILVHDAIAPSDSDDSQDSGINIAEIPDDKLLKLLELILGDPLYTLILSRHPSHMVRVMSAIKVKSFGIPLESAYILFDRLAELGDWDDKANKRLRDYHVRYIYSKPLSILNRRT
ncbi:MAG: hypothetical protein QXV17_06440 [Candidatus Micrarchaeaceae archaeon]